MAPIAHELIGRRGGRMIVQLVPGSGIAGIPPNATVAAAGVPPPSLPGAVFGDARIRNCERARR